MPERVRVGVIGAGGIAMIRHLPAYQEHVAAGKAEIVAVCDPVIESARRAAEQFNIPNVYSSYEDLLQAPGLDAVSICTPNSSHEPITLAAIRAGKHVMCEKPLALDLAGARRMTEAAKKAGIINAVNFRYRQIPAAIFARDLIQRGELGEVYHVYMIYANGSLHDPTTPIRWRLQRAETGSGVLGDLSSHLIDLCRFWLGEFTAVQGHLRTFVTERPLAGGGSGTVDVDDAASFFGKIEGPAYTVSGGTEAMIASTRYALGHANYQRAEVYGSKGAFVYEIERYDIGGDRLQVCLGAAQGRLGGYSTIPVPPSYLAGAPNRPMQDFIDAIINGKAATPCFEDGLKAQEVLEAVGRSASEGAWVKLPLE